MTDREALHDRERSPLRRVLSRVDRWASRPLTALLVIAADLAWVLLSVALGFPGLGERVFQTLVAAAHPGDGLVIQHTQCHCAAPLRERDRRCPAVSSSNATGFQGAFAVRAAQARQHSRLVRRQPPVGLAAR